jgi:hypothetical protein
MQKGGSLGESGTATEWTPAIEIWEIMQVALGDLR